MIPEETEKITVYKFDTYDILMLEDEKGNKDYLKRSYLIVNAGGQPAELNYCTSLESEGNYSNTVINPTNAIVHYEITNKETINNILNTRLDSTEMLDSTERRVVPPY